MILNVQYDVHIKSIFSSQIIKCKWFCQNNSEKICHNNCRNNKTLMEKLNDFEAPFLWTEQKYKKLVNDILNHLY